MKNLLLTFTLITILFTSCKKDEPDLQEEDIILISNVDAILTNSAIVHFKINRGNCKGPEIEIGFCFSESALPTINDRKQYTIAMCGYTGSKKISQLKGNTKHYVRGYLKKETGVVYGDVFSFTTLP
jgi:hypothetical protein